MEVEAFPKVFILVVVVVVVVAVPAYVVAENDVFIVAVAVCG